jgi:hypothetical protein
LLVLLHVVADLSRTDGVDVEMPKLRVRPSIGHGGAREIVPTMDRPQTSSSTRPVNGVHGVQRKLRRGLLLDMTDSSVAEQRASGLASFEVGQAVVGAVISWRGGDLVDIITHRYGEFTLTIWSRAAQSRGRLGRTVLQRRELAGLLDALRDQVDYPPVDRNLDLVALRAFVKVLAETVGPSASNLFEGARFAGISRDAGEGIVGHLGVGIDTVVTVHGGDGRVTFSFHVKPLPPGPFQPLSPPDLGCFVAALTTYLNDTTQADPLWRELLTDVSKAEGQLARGARSGTGFTD